jgi:hypothetical protein
MSIQPIMADQSYEPALPSVSANGYDVTPDQFDTAKLLEELLGKAVADRYLDFCELSFGTLRLRLTVPMAGHALRELDSVFRETMQDFAGVNPEPSEQELKKRNQAVESLRMPQMTPHYRRPIAHLNEEKPVDEKQLREDRLSDYVMVHYLWGTLPTDLLDEFLTVAPHRLRKHVMWFLGGEMRRGADMPADVRLRGQAYWEVRLSAAEATKDKEHYRAELGAIGSWTIDTAIPSDWLPVGASRLALSRDAPAAFVRRSAAVSWPDPVSARRATEPIPGPVTQAFFPALHLRSRFEGTGTSLVTQVKGLRTPDAPAERCFGA